MSTKVYDGYIVQCKDLLDLTHKLDRFAVELERVAFEEMNRVIGEIAARIIDMRDVGRLTEHPLGPEDVKVDGKSSPLLLANDHVMSKWRKIYETRRRDPVYDFGCTVYLFPIEGKVLARFSAERDGYVKAWEANPWVVRYPYWNNTDKPDELSDEAWDKRCRDWDEAYAAKARLKGLSRDVMTHEVGWLRFRCVEAALAAIRPKEKRADTLARDRVVHVKLKELVDPGEKQPSTWVRHFRGAQEWMETEEGEAAVAAERANFLPRLRDITKDDLTTKISANHKADQEEEKE